VAEAVVLPEDCARIVTELEALEDEARKIASPLDDAAFNWQPDRGRGWSVGQCLDHLVKTNRLYLDAMEDAVRLGDEQGLTRGQPLRPGRLGGWFIRQLEPPIRRRLPAPKKAIPAAHLNPPATLAAFGGEQQRMIDLVRAAAGLDCNAIRFRNPFAWGMRVFNLATGLLVVPAHERRHLEQARKVTARPDFPRA